VSEPIEFVDRYSALGVPYPDPETMCPGECEGLGVYPEPRIKNADGTIPVEGQEWEFVTCETCGGTGRRKDA